MSRKPNHQNKWRRHFKGGSYTVNIKRKAGKIIPLSVLGIFFITVGAWSFSVNLKNGDNGPGNVIMLIILLALGIWCILFAYTVTFSRLTVFPGKKIIYYNGFRKKEISWDEIRGYRIRRHYDSGKWDPLDTDVAAFSHTYTDVEIILRNNKRFASFDYYAGYENMEKLMRDLERLQ